MTEAQVLEVGGGRRSYSEMFVPVLLECEWGIL